MRRSRLVGSALLFTIVPSVALTLAQAPQAPKPGPEHAKLAAFAGTWKGQAEVKASPFGRGGKMTWTETCEWFEGGFHLVCKSSGESTAAKQQGLSILGWDAETTSYTYYSMDSTGWFNFAEGSVSGDTWIWGSERTMGGKIVRSRYTVHQLTPTSTKFTFEMQQDGGGWTLVMEGGSEKTK